MAPMRSFARSGAKTRRFATLMAIGSWSALLAGVPRESHGNQTGLAIERALLAYHDGAGWECPVLVFRVRVFRDDSIGPVWEALRVNGTPDVDAFVSKFDKNRNDGAEPVYPVILIERVRVYGKAFGILRETGLIDESRDRSLRRRSRGIDSDEFRLVVPIDFVFVLENKDVRHHLHAG
jgi:hypothetical protein